MANIFENAYFGKSYKTRDGRKAIYSYCIKGKSNEHYLIVDGNHSLLGGYGDNGIINACGYHNSNLDIVSEWQEPINEKETLYIRFGEIPKNGKSAIWKGDKCVGYEDGVSVYEAHRNIDGRYAPVIPYPLTQTTLDDFGYHLMYFRGRKFLVRGDLLGSIGSNGEPLLENVEIITEL